MTMKKIIPKRFLSLFLAFAMVIAMLPLNMLTASAASGSGKINNLSWSLVMDEKDPNSHTLTISGKGAMRNFTSSGTPWTARAGGANKITKIIIEEGVTSIGAWAFANYANLTEVTLPSTLTTIGNNAFMVNSSMVSSKLTSITIPNSVTTIGDCAFLGTGLTSVTIPASVTSLGSSAFATCLNLSSVTFAENCQITTLKTNTFQTCTSLTSIEIPASITTFQDAVFWHCTALESITYLGTNEPSFGQNIFKDSNKVTYANVPSDYTSNTFGILPVRKASSTEDGQYTITLNKTETIELFNSSAEKAGEGDEVLITVKTACGYYIDKVYLCVGSTETELKYIEQSRPGTSYAKDTEVQEYESSKYSFKMPASDVSLRVETYGVFYDITYSTYLSEGQSFVSTEGWPTKYQYGVGVTLPTDAQITGLSEDYILVGWWNPNGNKYGIFTELTETDFADKNIAPKFHKHELTCTAVGTTISVTCTEEIYPASNTLKLPGTCSGSVTLIAPTTPISYNGEPHGASLENNLSSYVTAPTIQYQKKTGDNTWSEKTADIPVDAGTYMASITMGDETVSVEYTIDRTSGLSADAQGYMGNYDGEEHKISVEPSVEDATVTYSIDGGKTYVSEEPTFKTVDDSGTVHYKVSHKNYEDFNGTVTVTINPKEIEFDWGGTEYMAYTGETVVPEATATNLIDGDGCELTVSVLETTDGAGIQPGKWTAKITGVSNSNYKLPTDNLETTYTIYGTQSKPEVIGVDETIDGKNDGKITGLTTEMEYATKENALDNEYKRITDIDMTFATGTYYVRYAAKQYYYSSDDTVVVIDAGRKLNVTVPSAPVGYTIKTKDAELEWNGSTTLEFTLADGYSKTNSFVVKVNGNPVTLTDNKYTITNVQTDIIVIVEGVADTTEPTAEITLGTNKWNKFFNTITFGLFFKETQSVSVTAEDVDTGSGMDKIYYYLASEELTEENVAKITDWKEYTGPFNIDPNNKYIIYVKAVDNSNNVTYISSKYGIVLDSIAPVITGVENSGTYYGNTEFGVTESYIKAVTVDGTSVTPTDGKYTIVADGKEHTIVATDEAGNNSATMKITVITIASLDDTIETIKTTDVKSSDKEEIQGVLDTVNTLIASGKDFTDEEDATLNNIKTNAEALLNQIDKVANEVSGLTSSVNGYEESKVKSEDKDAINDLISDIDVLLGGNNLTEAEKTALGEVKATAEKLIKKIDDTATEMKDITDKVGAYDEEKVTSDDKQTLTELVEDIDKLLEGDNLTEAEKTALGEEKAEAEELIKKIDDTATEMKDLTDKVDIYDETKVTSDDKQALTELIEDIDKLLEGDNLTEEEKETLGKVKTDAEAIVKKIDEVAAADDTENTQKVENITSDNVTTDNKGDLEKAKDDLEKVLEDYNDNLTEDEKKAIEDEIKRIDEALEVIGNVETVEDKINKLPDTITKNDAEEIKAAKAAYDALSKYEQSIIDKDVKKKLDNAITALENLNKASTSPDTGDNTNIWMWFAVLFVSGMGLFGTIVYDRKKKQAK